MATPIRTPNSSWNSMRVVARLAAMRPVPRSTLPDSTTNRVPNRSESTPQKKEAAPIHRKSSVAASDMPLRDQPVSVAIGCRKTASENIDPMPTQVSNIPAPTTTQPYDSFISHPTPLRVSHADRFNIRPTCTSLHEAKWARRVLLLRACTLRENLSGWKSWRARGRARTPPCVSTADDLRARGPPRLTEDQPPGVAAKPRVVRGEAG